MMERIAPIIELILDVDRRSRLLDLPDGTAEVVGFYCDYEWYRLERQVRVGVGVCLVHCVVAWCSAPMSGCTRVRQGLVLSALRGGQYVRVQAVTAGRGWHSGAACLAEVSLR